MEARIWKYELAITDTQEVMMPQGALILSVANQNGKLCLWAMVVPANPDSRRIIEIIGTGNPFEVDTGIDRKFIGTAIIGSLVWHVFEH